MKKCIFAIARKDHVVMLQDTILAYSGTTAPGPGEAITPQHCIVFLNELKRLKIIGHKVRPDKAGSVNPFQPYEVAIGIVDQCALAC